MSRTATAARSSPARIAARWGTVEDYKLSKTGHATITVRQASGVCFKTLARNVEKC
jgi:hypothetical protein